MEAPIFIFGIITLVIVSFFILNIKKIKKRRKSLILKLFISILLLSFSWIWFVPMHIGWNGEIPICRFRFQVFENSSDDYGSVPSLKSNLFEYRPRKYGRLYLEKRIGGIKEYFIFSLPDRHNSYINYTAK